MPNAMRLDKINETSFQKIGSQTPRLHPRDRLSDLHMIGPAVVHNAPAPRGRRGRGGPNPDQAREPSWGALLSLRPVSRRSRCARRGGRARFAVAKPRAQRRAIRPAQQLRPATQAAALSAEGLGVGEDVGDGVDPIENNSQCVTCACVVAGIAMSGAVACRFADHHRARVDPGSAATERRAISAAEFLRCPLSKLIRALRQPRATYGGREDRPRARA